MKKAISFALSFAVIIQVFIVPAGAATALKDGWRVYYGTSDPNDKNLKTSVITNTKKDGKYTIKVDLSKSKSASDALGAVKFAKVTERTYYRFSV